MSDFPFDDHALTGRDGRVKRLSSAWGWQTWAGGIRATLIAAALLTVGLSTSGCGPSAEERERALTQMLAEGFQQHVEANKQAIFSRIHPVGRAKGTELNELRISAWRDGRRTGKWEDAAAYDYVFTIYWESPLITDGYTQIHTHRDLVADTMRSRVVATNGLTNREADGFFEFLGGLLGR